MTTENVVVKGVRAERLNFDDVSGDILTVNSSLKNIDAVNSMDVDIRNSNPNGQGVDKRKLGNCRDAVNQQETKKQLKRKKEGHYCDVDNETLIAKCKHELVELFEYYKDFLGLEVNFEDGNGGSFNSFVALLLEEKNVSFSKIVAEIYEKSKGRDGVTLASVRAAVLSVGQRTMYGMSNADTDVLEDESESCLWCWETRDLKLLPLSLRGSINIRRTARKMIHRRVSALSEALSDLSKSESLSVRKSNLLRISTKLGKSSNKEAISSLVEKMNKKSCAEMAVKDAKLKEKEIEKSNRSAEKEKMKLDRELQKENLRAEKELKRKLDESRKDEKRREKEDVEMQKRAKKQHEEAFREQQRREKEEAELRKQLATQKQASVMERFLKSKKSSSDTGNLENFSTFKLSLPEKCPNEVVDAATTLMDRAFSQQFALSIEDIRRSHLESWHRSASYNRSCHWGIRYKPKIDLVKDLKLQRSSWGAFTTPNKESSTCKVKNDGDPSYEKLDDESEEPFPSNDMPYQNNPVHIQNKKLLQFDKSFRPAYYGTWQKKSNFVGPRNPLKKDPELDYEVDSDDEWEEEDPGESLSDCDKDNEELLEEESMKTKDDDDESEDSFVVPDGYLSENEGVEVEISSHCTEDKDKFLPCSTLENVGEEFQALLHQQTLLCKWTEKALRKTQPLVISNLNHDKVGLLLTEDLSGISKIEQVCLQALCMRMWSSGSVIDLPTNYVPEDEHQEVCQPSKESISQATTSQISDLDLPEIVKSIQSCPYGINKVVEVLKQKFPASSKTTLSKKVREISVFLDNRWQVKKDILEKLGLDSAPVNNGKGGSLKGIAKCGSLKGIASYFQKRCPPPASDTISISENTLEKCSILTADHGQTDSQRPSGSRPNL